MNSKHTSQDFQPPENKIAMSAIHENRFAAANCKQGAENMPAKPEAKPK